METHGWNANNHHNDKSLHTSWFHNVTSELSAALFSSGTANTNSTAYHYPTLQALMKRTGCHSQEELTHLSDDEFRELTLKHAHYTPLQHATAWHERRKQQQQQSFFVVMPSSPVSVSSYNLQIMSNQTDLSVTELTKLVESDFIILSKQVLQNGTLYHAKVYMEYIDAQNNHDDDDPTRWIRSWTTCDQETHHNSNDPSTTPCISCHNDDTTVNDIFGCGTSNNSHSRRGWERLFSTTTRHPVGCLE